MFLSVSNTRALRLWFLVWRYLLYNVRLPETNPPDENPWVCMQVIKIAPFERGYHIPSWGPCVFDHMVQFTSCNVQKKGTLLNYHNFHPDFSVWIDPLENKNHQQVEVGETLLNVLWSKQIADPSAISTKLVINYIYIYMYVHGVPLFCDFRSAHFYRSLPQPTPVPKPQTPWRRGNDPRGWSSSKVACDVETFLGTWMVQCEPPQLCLLFNKNPSKC